MKSITLSSKIIIDKYRKINFQIDQDLNIFLKKLNFSLTPITFKKNKIDFKNLKNSNGLILAGGGDLHKYKANKVNKIRDNYEKKLFRYYYKKDKPILAICRGFQLIVDIYGIKLERIDNHVKKIHSLKIGRSKFIKDKILKVNSYHNYCIKDLPKNFIKVSNTKDGSIEIAEHKSKKILCLMFHPERVMKSQKLVLKSLKNFFK
jgi:gamma-glutamyl-gamma-aminobutyrate hydrolase PuuD